MAIIIAAGVAEKIFIGDDVTMMVGSISHNRVELEFKASNVVIEREKIRLERLMGLKEKSKLTKEAYFSERKISRHITEVRELHKKNKSDQDTLRLMRLLKGFESLPDEYLLGIVAIKEELN